MESNFSAPDKRIVEFINKHHVLTLATYTAEGVWCSNCFYVYLPDENIFVFTSDDDTKHARQAHENSAVSASIVLETNVIGKIQGVQLTGTMTRPEGEEEKLANRAYMKRFPFALLMNTSLWVLRPDYIKMTHNLLGFGKKLIWDDRQH